MTKTGLGSWGLWGSRLQAVRRDSTATEGEVLTTLLPNYSVTEETKAALLDLYKYDFQMFNYDRSMY